VTGLGTSLGYHRLLTHRSFRTTRWITAMALAAGAMAVPSRPIDWAARHLEHHANADRDGDPHSPVDGLLHAHVGWLFAVSPAKRERYCRRLMDDPVVMAIERTAVVWLALGLLVPALIDRWRGLLWGGIVRIAIHNHTMFAVNSICHAFGSQPFRTGDERRNTAGRAQLCEYQPGLRVLSDCGGGRCMRTSPFPIRAYARPIPTRTAPLLTLRPTDRPIPSRPGQPWSRRSRPRSTSIGWTARPCG
jgi:fatty acid desaturase